MSIQHLLAEVLKNVNGGSKNFKFNSAYYLLRTGKVFFYYSELLKPQFKNESYTTDRAVAKFVNVIGKVTRESLKSDLEKERYYSVLNDGSTDVS